MKFTTLLFPTAALGAVCAKTSCPYGYGQFQPEKPTDTRGVCPMLNTLANHGYLPRTGRDINENTTVSALYEALNLAPDFGRFLFRAGRLANPLPNATTFNLDHLNRHDFFEHDGSLSRQDAFFGPWARFNQTVWGWTLQYLDKDVIDVQTMANARASRVTRSMLTNPDFKMSDVGYLFSVAESAAVLSIIGDKRTQTCPRKFVDFLFVNERLPHEVGWKKSSVPITLDDLVTSFAGIENHTSFPDSPPPDNTTEIFNQGIAQGAKRCSPHLGCF
ncbi:Cloroperoxidase [Xylariaceae sp. FL0594]|nr:Cloroperoxidase [Xylariaceae sp. FL0594]